MTTLFLFVCLLVGCLAQRPQPCTSPPLMSGGLSVSTQSEKLAAFAKYAYDGLGRRIRLSDFGSFDNKTFHLDVLLLYKQGVMYKINNRDQTCLKRRLSTDFIPLAVPKDASLVGQVVLGSSSVPGEEILVNTWTGTLLTKKGSATYVSTVTEFGCIPVSTLLSTDKRGWVAVSFFNNVVGLVDPQDLSPPLFCSTAQLEEEDRDTHTSFLQLL
ncbi:ependymin-like [Poeciliopsis prolifica]|uniref:ependymin-like n=1 Tax=Poeciliopsis prolifica TaxID=188132 RepID=UPI002413D85F|nr:ependymin-like [Poeciliopsis prolifica]